MNTAVMSLMQSCVFELPHASLSELDRLQRGRKRDRRPSHNSSWSIETQLGA